MKKILMIVAVGLMSLPLFAQTADNSDVLRRADVMPVFQDCDDERFADHPYRCTIMQLMAHFDDAVQLVNVVGAQTKAHLKFVVEKDGSVSNVNLVRGVVVNDSSVAQQLDAGIVAVANQLEFQSAGKQDGEVVRVQVEFSVSLNY
tara:strand:+ start:284 stop:721 length:438 start_codon:yes stop_codon:yes gene_type:complete